MQKLAAIYSERIGVLDTTHVQAVLQKVVLLDSGHCYEFSLDGEADPDSFATLVILPIPTGQVSSN